MAESNIGPSAAAASASSSTTIININGPSSYSSMSTSSLVREEENNQHENEQNQHHQRPQQSSSMSYRVNISIGNGAHSQTRDDVWSCTVVLVTFWLLASMTLILVFYGSVDLQLGPNCSRLIQTNSFFVQSIKVQQINEPKPGPVLHGFYEPPPLDTEITWSETHSAFIPVNFHKEWVYFLNKGSKLDISYNVKSPTSLPLSLVIAQGRQSIAEWIEDPSSPNSTLSWNIIYGTGTIEQEIPIPSSYYISLGNLNSEEVEVLLKFTMKAVLYDTSKAYWSCSLGNHLCSLKLMMMGTSVAVLTSPGPKEGTNSENWYVKLSFGPRWIIYFIGSGMMTTLILLSFRFYIMYQATNGNRGELQAGEMGNERAPLLSQKDDDTSSWGSSYDSISHGEEDLDEWTAGNSLDGKTLTEGENYNNINNPQRLCVVCFSAPRDCFFLPCGHCAACFSCGTRIAEEAGACPVCRRSMKKVRKIFIV
ncbi:E3 ubiquitin-protein ligase APD2-like isoform X2 [Tripterygium wilfordii]|uniref:E3 ubiquitin-protein ligase APD2-like isoform X2 n=1 Tax=Tripterygium wilfordii TaxID=458696 RepID=UPI0018F85797|nr:E3 ubiquitin-protein ligase APD2-like isoform X2 [Tripterygium wilfordii]